MNNMGKVSNRRAKNTPLLCVVVAWVRTNAMEESLRELQFKFTAGAQRSESSSSVVLHCFGAIENIGARVPFGPAA
jgi:hypothetical protein